MSHPPLGADFQSVQGNDAPRGRTDWISVQPSRLSRREMLARAGLGIGSLALTNLLLDEGALADESGAVARRDPSAKALRSE